MASNSGWSKGLPSGTSNIALGDNDIRSNQSVVQAAFEDEHYFTDGSTASAGVHKAGSARAWYQAAAPTAVLPTGQLWVDSDDGVARVASAAGTSSWITIVDGRLSGSSTYAASATLAQGQCPLSHFVNIVSGGANCAVTLPSAAPGLFCIINIPFSATTLWVYPASGDKIDALSTNVVGYQIYNNTLPPEGPVTVGYYAISASEWYTIISSSKGTSSN